MTQTDLQLGACRAFRANTPSYALGFKELLGVSLYGGFLYNNPVITTCCLSGKAPSRDQLSRKVKASSKVRRDGKQVYPHGWQIRKDCVIFGKSMTYFVV